VLLPEAAKNRVSRAVDLKTEQAREKENNRIGLIQTILNNHTVNKKRKKEDIDYVRFNIIKTTTTTTKNQIHC
jgi:uncharacterized protein Veg